MTEQTSEPRTAAERLAHAIYAEDNGAPASDWPDQYAELGIRGFFSDDEWQRIERIAEAAALPAVVVEPEGSTHAPAGLPPEALDWARQLVEQGYRDEHIVTFTETGYGLEHPIRCRPNLIGCQFNEWLASQMAPDQEPGRYVMTWAKSGPKYAVYAEGEPDHD